MSKKIRDDKEELKIPRIIITISLIVLAVAYFICLATQKFNAGSILCVIIAIAAGVFLFTLGLVIRSRDKRVDLDYDSIVVWKLCVVSGIIIAGFGIFCLVMSF